MLQPLRRLYHFLTEGGDEFEERRWSARSCAWGVVQ